MPHLPAVLPQCVVVGAWKIDPTEFGQEFQACFQVRGPAQDAPIEQRVNFETTRIRHRIFARLMGLQFDRTGDWVFTLELNGHKQATHTVHVAVEEPTSPS